MAEHVLQFNYNFKGKAEKAYEAILDMRQFGKYHPYMTTVDVLQTTPDFTEFDIREKVLLLGFIPNKPHYTAKAYEVEKGRHIRYTSNVKSAIDLVIDFYFNYKEESHITFLNENVKIMGSSIPAKILGSIITKSHKILFSEMHKHLYLKNEGISRIELKTGGN
ncbi:MAG: hypothetical protein ACXVPN_00130 [Bacteroidia bacterium]